MRRHDSSGAHEGEGDMSDNAYRWSLRAVAAEAALAAVTAMAERQNDMQQKMIDDGREGLQRLVSKGLDMDTRDLVDCGHALGVSLKFDFTQRRKVKGKP